MSQPPAILRATVAIIVSFAAAFSSQCTKQHVAAQADAAGIDASADAASTSGGMGGTGGTAGTSGAFGHAGSAGAGQPCRYECECAPLGSCNNGICVRLLGGAFSFCVDDCQCADGLTCEGGCCLLPDGRLGAFRDLNDPKHCSCYGVDGGTVCTLDNTGGQGGTSGGTGGVGGGP